MFGLLQGLWKSMSYTTEKKVLLLGLDGAGKTTLNERVKSIYAGFEPLPSSKIHPTVGLNIARIKRGASTLLIWDLGGKASLRSLWRNYLSEADAIIWVLDATDPSRVEEARETIREVFSDLPFPSRPWLIFTNKQDASMIMETNLLVSALKIPLQEHDNFLVTGCSALTGQGVQHGFDWLMERLRI